MGTGNTEPRAIGRWVAVVAVIGAVALSLAACGGGGGGVTEAASADGKRPIKMAGVFCICFVGPYVAMQNGYFEDAGVPVEQYIATKGGSDTFTALASGDVDFGLSGLDAILRGREKGQDVKSVATVSPEFYALTVRDDLTGEITSVEDLSGRKVAISKIGSASWAFLQFALHKAGMEDGDVEILQLGGIDTIMAGLKSGQVDAAVTWEPGTSQAELTGSGTPILDMLDPEDHQQLLGAPSSISMTLAAKDSLLKSDPAMVKNVIAALTRADEWIKSHSAEEVAKSIAPMAEGLDPKVLTASVRATMATLPRSPAVSEEAYQSSATLLQQAGVITKVPPIGDPFDCKIARCEQ
jgi:NitT/TauT family transport system substrate-binding protein